MFLVSVDSLFSSQTIVWSYSNSESVHRRHQTCRPRLPTNLRGFPPRINPERSSHVKRKRRKFISTLLSCAEPVLMVQKTISKLLLWEQKHINFLSFSSSHKYSPIQKAKKRYLIFSILVSFSCAPLDRADLIQIVKIKWKLFSESSWLCLFWSPRGRR